MIVMETVQRTGGSTLVTSSSRSPCLLATPSILGSSDRELRRCDSPSFGSRSRTEPQRVIAA